MSNLWIEREKINAVFNPPFSLSFSLVHRFRNSESIWNAFFKSHKTISRRFFLFPFVKSIFSWILQKTRLLKFVSILAELKPCSISRPEKNNCRYFKQFNKYGIYKFWDGSGHDSLNYAVRWISHEDKVKVYLKITSDKMFSVWFL